MLTFCHDGHDVMFRGRCALSPYDTLQSKYTDHIENFEKRHSYDTGMQTTARSCVSVDAKPTVFVHVDEPYAAVNEQLDCCRTYRNGRWQITLSHGGGWGRIATRREMATPKDALSLVRSSVHACRGRRGLSSSFHGSSCILRLTIVQKYHIVVSTNTSL
jgi:hypothetical protein